MYEAKQSGTPTALYTRPAGAPLERLALMTRLRKAAEQMDFVLHWMPVIDLVEERACGVEALIRWYDGERGWILPGEFIALAEETAVIDQLGTWVMAEAARRQVAWAEEGLDLDVSVNMSWRQLWRPDLVTGLVQAVEDAGADPARFIVDVTEAAAAKVPHSEDSLINLREAGLRVAIDDFAHSSLTDLGRMQLDILKIDGSLVADAGHQAGETMIRAIAQLATSLGLRPLAESIETRSQFELVREIGCPLGQGHFFTRALPTEHVPDFVRSFRLPPGVDPWVEWEASRLDQAIPNGS
jgi:EAL domain-containing protein (putative c-di-GMP-specific phosphodiesterase class I)